MEHLMSYFSGHLTIIMRLYLLLTDKYVINIIDIYRKGKINKL